MAPTNHLKLFVFYDGLWPALSASFRLDPFGGEKS
jgi:hypothetical protein